MTREAAENKRAAHRYRERPSRLGREGKWLSTPPSIEPGSVNGVGNSLGFAGKSAPSAAGSNLLAFGWQARSAEITPYGRLSVRRSGQSFSRGVRAARRTERPDTG